MLNVLSKAKALSSRDALGSFASTPVTPYGHQISASSGMSYPIPGVSGMYKDPTGKLVFVKGVPNELTAIHEPIGTEITRKLFGIEAPVQRAVTVSNPYDPKKKSKLLALESDYDPRFANTNVDWDEDTVIRQLANSLLMNNKDLSRSNVYGNFNPDVGQAGVFSKASGNMALADEMNSMERQAMINLLAVKGGARKDFARDTAPIVAKMTPKKYGRLMKKTLEKARPELVKIINALPEGLKEPYIKMLARLDEGLDVDWSKYHAVHSNPKYLNAGGPVGGGPVKRGRSAYGAKKGAQRPGNPAARAAWESEQRAQRERDAAAARSRAASHQVYGQQALTTGLGREAVRTGTTSFYNPGQVMINNMLDPFKNSAMMKARYLQAAFNIASDSVMKGSIRLNLEVLNAATKMGNAYKKASGILTRYAASAQSAILSGINSVKNFGPRFKNAIIEEQTRYAATRYPAGQAPSQGFFGPGLVGQYRDVGEGVQARKVGVLGRRKTEYLVNNASTGGHSVVMTPAMAKANGVSIPQRANGMSMGSQMGIGMAGSMGGMALMGQEKVGGMTGMQAGMGLMVASSILPMLPYARMSAGIKSAGTAVKGFSASAAGLTKGIALVARLAKGFGLVGAAITAATAVFQIYKGIQDSKQDASMGLSLTAKAAEQAGIKYTSLNDQMTLLIENRKLEAAAAKGGAGLSVGMPGLAMSVKEMKEAKVEGAKLKDFIESLNRSEGFDETLRLVSNQKAQFVAAGMTVEEANKKIYGALANSNQAAESFKILSNQTFSGIVDKATAAEFAVGNLINTLNRGAGTVDFGKEIGAGFEGLINTFDLTIESLIGTKNSAEEVIDQYAAFNQVMSDFEKIYGDKLNKPIGSEAYNALARSNYLLGEITTRADSVAGVLAKWTLYSANFAADLSLVDSDLAVKLAGFTAAVQGAMSDLGEAGGKADTFGRVENALDRLKATMAAVSAASQRAAAAAQRSAQEELKLISKKIKLIDDEKNKKLESLRATQDAANYALELQKLQIEYSDAISRGDMTAASIAKIDIDQLTLNRQTDLAQKAIEDAAAKAKEPLEKKATSIQDKSEARSNAAAVASDNSAAAKEIATELERLQSKYNDLQVEAINVKLLPPEQQKAAQAAVDAKIFALVKEIQKSGTGNSLMAKTIRDGFFRYFDENGKAIALIKTSNQYVGSVLSETKTQNTKILDLFKVDTNLALKQAELITGGMKIKQLRDDLVEALLRYRPNTPEGTASGEINNPGSAKDYSKQKSLGSAGKEAAKPPVLGGSAEKYTRINNDGMEETFTVFTYKGKSYVVDSGGGVYAFDYGAQTIVGLDKPPVAKAANGGYIKSFEPGGKVSGPGTSTSDSIRAMLSDGEYVFSAKAVDAAGGPDVVDEWHNALRRADGGTVRQQLPNFPWRPDLPNYWSNGKPTGSPYTGRWGELRYNPSKGKDIWGGTEIPGLKFTGKTPQQSDYWHQMTEQPSKSHGPGMGIDKDPMRYAGSGASMGGIGNGAYGFGPLMFHKGGPVGHKHGISGLWNKFKDQANKSITGSMAVGLLEQIGTLGQGALSKLMPSIVSKPTKQQDKNLIEFSGVPGAYRALTNKSAEGPMGKDALAAQKLIDWTSLAGFAIPGGKGLAGSASKFSTNVADKVVARQGVQVIDKNFPKSINTLMQATGIKPNRLKITDEILTRYQDAIKAAKADNPSRPVPEIVPGQGIINMYDPLMWSMKGAWDKGYRTKGKIKNVLGVMNGNPVKDNTAYMKHVTGDIFMPNNSEVSTLFHELGHRDLMNSSVASKTILGPLWSKKPSSGTHEGYADRFAAAARSVSSNYLNKQWTHENFADRFANGRSYVTAGHLTTIQDFFRYIGGAGTGRGHQIGSTWLNDYIAASGSKLEKPALDKIKIFRTMLEKYEKEYSYAPGVLLHKLPALKAAYSKMLEQKGLENLGIPKFEDGINMVPADMLAVLHKNEAVLPERFNPFNPNASAATSSSVYNIQVDLNGTNVTAQDVAAAIHNEMRIKEMTSGINRNVGRP